MDYFYLFITDIAFKKRFSYHILAQLPNIMQSTLIVGIIIFTGFVFGEFAKYFRLPRVTGYIIAGIVLNPRLTGIIPENFVDHTALITNISLSFITFSVGGTLLFSNIRRLGKSIMYITLFEAEFAFLAVITGFLLLAPYLIHLPNVQWITYFVPLALLLGALASPTDPSATLAVVHEYRAKGDVTSTIMGVAAFDDALGIINYSIAIAFASAFALNKSFSFSQSILSPLYAILGGIIVGIVFGWLLSLIISLLKRKSDSVYIVLIISMLTICFGIARALEVDELLATMAMGAFVVNFNRAQVQIFKVVEHYVEELIFVIFFTLSGMHLDFSVLASAYLLILLFVIFRMLGKVSGTMAGATIAKSSPAVKKYTAGGLIPQGGIVIGLALMLNQNPAFTHVAHIIISIIIGSTVIHELVGPVLSTLALKKANELNKP